MGPGWGWICTTLRKRKETHQDRKTAFHIPHLQGFAVGIHCFDVLLRRAVSAGLDGVFGDLGLFPHHLCGSFATVYSIKEPGHCGQGRGRRLWHSLESPSLRFQSRRFAQATGKRDNLYQNAPDVINVQIHTSFLITFVALRKSSEVITGPPAAAAFTNKLEKRRK